MRRTNPKASDDGLSFIAGRDPDVEPWLYRMAGRTLRDPREQRLRPPRDRARGWRRRQRLEHTTSAAKGGQSRGGAAQ